MQGPMSDLSLGRRGAGDPGAATGWGAPVLGWQLPRVRPAVGGAARGPWRAHSEYGQVSAQAPRLLTLEELYIY